MVYSARLMPQVLEAIDELRVFIVQVIAWLDSVAMVALEFIAWLLPRLLMYLFQGIGWLFMVAMVVHVFRVIFWGFWKRKR